RSLLASMARKTWPRVSEKFCIASWTPRKASGAYYVAKKVLVPRTGFGCGKAGTGGGRDA
ncbi:MAG TPA: hypothetical protein VMQ76_04710, partial [Terracidiphilus sp.]|nr:hypothetical protein [Terracidiphilus sp.]